MHRPDDQQNVLGKSPDFSLRGRKFLCLQGPSSRFYIHLGRALAALGATVARIGFSPADRLYWSTNIGQYYAFRDQPEVFADWFSAMLSKTGTTDVLMLGDGRIYHRAALSVLKDIGIKPWIFELGYLRPDFLTIYDANKGPLPHTDETVADLPSERFSSSFLRNAAQDVSYHLTNSALSWMRYPHYRPHALDGPVREYSGWIRKGILKSKRRIAAKSALSRIGKHCGPIFLVPLQLDTDFQLRLRGTGQSQDKDLAAIMASFRDHAPDNALLVVKEHPLDNSLRQWKKISERLASANNISQRHVFLDGGSVETIFERCAGVVTINSTVGLSALIATIPVHVLGQAIYDQPGLTHSGCLDDFWKNGLPPDVHLVDRFRRNLRAYSHVPGSFDGPGALAGARNIARHIAKEAQA